MIEKNRGHDDLTKLTIFLVLVLFFSYCLKFWIDVEVTRNKTTMTRNRRYSSNNASCYLIIFSIFASRAYAGLIDAHPFRWWSPDEVAILRGIQSSSDEVLSNVDRMNDRRLETVFDPESVNEKLRYEDKYTLTYYFPMLFFLMINLVALVAGLGLLITNLHEQKNNDVLEDHKRKQNEMNDATFNTTFDTTFDTTTNGIENDKNTVEEELLEVGDLTLSVDASCDEIELTLTGEN